jgi:drug/metabolite transporter (DMT)-like permease
VFDEITGLPVHPLAVHFAVALLVASVLLAFLFVVPHTRAWARLPLLLVSWERCSSRTSPGRAARRWSGSAGRGPKPRRSVAELVNEHQEASNVLWWLVLGFAVVAVASFVLTRERTTGGTAHGVAAVLVVVAVVLAFFTYRVGDLGAKAVWDPTDSVDYNT